MRDPKEFCILPFNAVSISPRGVIRACCWLNSPASHSQPNVKDFEKTITWPTDYIRDLQHLMRTSTAISQEARDCASCYHNERTTGWSHRKYETVKWFNRLNDRELESLIDQPRITSADIQFGFLCNISCLMCTPAQSSHLATTHAKLIRINKDPQQQEFYRSRVDYLDDHRQDWTTNPESFQKVKDLCSDLEEINISGGEPLMNPRFAEFLEYLVSKPVKLRFLMLTTNGTIYDPNIVDLLNRIPTVRLKISIDGLGPVDEFIRWPTNWEQKQANITKYVDTVRGQDQSIFLLGSVIQSLNIFDLANVRRWAMSFDPSRRVHHHLQVASLPTLASLRHASVDYLDYYLDSLPDKEKIAQVTETVRAARPNTDRSTSRQLSYYQDLAQIQKKNLDSLFPIYSQFHQL